jgi:hypothetical protein
MSVPRALIALLGCLALVLAGQVAVSSPARAGDSSPAGNWWAVDSVSRVNDASLAAVRAWYQNGTPQVWGRYISDIGSTFTLNSDEIDYAAKNGIYLYLLAADHSANCGTDVTYDQGVADAQVAIAAAQALKVPPGVILFKDFEERSSRCPSDPSAGFLVGWYAAMKNSNLYKAGFYGNSYYQTNAFSKAYCGAAAAMGGFLDNTTIAAAEPEPAFNNARGTVGPRNAPLFAPTKPSCALPSATTIWQYGEVGSQAGNIADVDLVLPNTPGLLAPNGTATGSSAIRAGSTVKNLLVNGGFNSSLTGWSGLPGTHMGGYASGVGGTQAFEGTGFGVTSAVTPTASTYQDVPMKIATGDTYCATIQATTLGAATGGKGSFALWMTGGRAENSSVSMPPLLGNSVWSPAEVCTTATSPHTGMRVQFYPRVGGQTVGLDGATLVRPLLKNGGFNGATNPWRVMASTNMAPYRASATGSYPYEGGGYLATNTRSPNGGVYQDVNIAIAKGSRYCASGRFTSVGTGSTAGGRMVVWLLGGGGNEQANVTLTNLPGNSVWTLGQACVTATTNHTTLRVQYYAAVYGPTVGMDAIIVD